MKYAGPLLTTSGLSAWVVDRGKLALSCILAVRKVDIFCARGWGREKCGISMVYRRVYMDATV